MIRLMLISLICITAVTLAMAGFPHGGDMPHKPGSGSQPGLILDVPGFTPGHHNGDDLLCSDCHIMHGSAQHDYGYSDPYTYPFTQDPPTNKLLKAPNAVSLCLNCHQDYVGIPDVVGADVNGGVKRAAGHFDEVGILNNNGHNLGPTSGTGGYEVCNRCHFGGDFATAVVECIDCHSPHGTGYYRNLQWATDPGNEPPIIAFVNPAASNLDIYQAANIAYAGSEDDTWREVTNICLDCHHVYSGGYTNPDADLHWNRHPMTDTERGTYRPVGMTPGDPYYDADSTNWYDGTGSEFSVGRLAFMVTGAHDYATASQVDYDNEVFCLTCHQAHGSDNSFGMRWNPADADNPIRTAGCRQCHNNVTGSID